MNYTNIEIKWGNIISKAGERYDDGSPVYDADELLEEFMPTLRAYDDMHEASNFIQGNYDLLDLPRQVKDKINKALAKV